jgi:peptidoglycan DL-endopeptidase CwlO
MTLEAFVRAAGAAMGAAQDSFGTAAVGTAGDGASAASAPAMPANQVSGSGQAVDAFGAESSRLNAHATVLGEQDSSARAQLANAVAAAGSGRARMGGIISGATADVSALAPASNTPQGQRALVAALTRRLQETQQALQGGQSDATTHAAASHVTAADYHTVAPFSSGGTATASPAAAASMGAAPLAGLSSVPGLMSSSLGAGGGQSGNQRNSTNAAGGAGTGSSVIDAVVSRALSQHGTPYVWGGGGPHGPTNGGFDCSSLMQYAFAGAGVDLPRTTYQQIGLGQPVSPGDIRAGDLVFSNFGEGGTPGPGHVQLAISSTHVVEAPHTGTNVQVSAIPAGHVVVRRILH